ncbi:uncharacterized protein LOC141613538 [Silene latifolia]|uniref:uncharacterized protein LOC141613538 n=1 Tax=Silene latifolia TaxID=37657 RepID=UPI003D780407
MEKRANEYEVCCLSREIQWLQDDRKKLQFGIESLKNKAFISKCERVGPCPHLPAVTFNKVDIHDSQEHHDALIITLSMINCTVKKVLVDTRSSVNLVMLETIRNMGFNEEDLQKKTIPLVGFSRETSHLLGGIIIPTYARGVNKQKQCVYADYVEPPTEELDKVGLDKLHLERTVLVEAECAGNIRQQIVDFLKTYMDCFDWSHDDMDVDSLLAAGKIRDVKYPEWLSNVVVVPKKNGKWRVCVDFTNLNEAGLNDPFPLPHIDAMVDAT